jgi:hypothetical protein
VVSAIGEKSGNLGGVGALSFAPFSFPANSIGDNNEQAERLVLGYRCGRDMHVGILAGVGTSICHRERTGTPWRARHQTGCPADRTVGKDRLQESKQQEQFGMP